MSSWPESTLSPEKVSCGPACVQGYLNWLANSNPHSCADTEKGRCVISRLWESQGLRMGFKEDINEANISSAKLESISTRCFRCGAKYLPGMLSSSCHPHSKTPSLHGPLLWASLSPFHLLLLLVCSTTHFTCLGPLTGFPVAQLQWPVAAKSASELQKLI